LNTFRVTGMTFLWGKKYGTQTGIFYANELMRYISSFNIICSLDIPL